MRIEQPWFLSAAAAIVLQILIVAASPYTLAQPWDALWHFLAYAGLTLVLWIATDGRHPLVVSAAAMLLGALLGQLAPAVPAAALTAGALFLLQGKPRCVESSPR
jgi:VanZ family protein